MISPSRQLCVDATETTSHVLRNCKFAKLVWDKVLNQPSNRFFGYDDLMSSIEWNIAGKRNSSQQREITLFVVTMDAFEDLGTNTFFL